MIWFHKISQRLMLLLFLTFVCFSLMSLMPGDPLDLMIQSNPNVTEADVLRIKKMYGLDLPIYQRYFNWLKEALQGDLGYSRTYRIPVSEVIGPKLWNTFILSFSSLVFSLIIAIPLGILAAVKPRSFYDYLINFFSFGGISMPSFFLGILLILIFAVQLKIFPASGTYSMNHSELSGWDQFKDRLSFLILPLLSLSFQQIGLFLRFTRASFLEVMKQDFIRTARAKGLSGFQVLIKHAFRNALLPLITIVALSFSNLFSGATVTETVFAYQGVGKLVYDSIISNDFNVAMVSFLISVSMVLLFNLIADLLYVWADPRIKTN